ncbi:zona pellucida-like domain protein [Teladorsagia circumcincta]|uniref:Zona pellucida-like domain protein n=2 Tax=Teladorsagia circumcincta TaxID=45464 RepID=A0A2G9V1C4_TELCI|nr:zona pellucida-like domain protein [Teladorsagia circumcincta]
MLPKKIDNMNVFARVDLTLPLLHEECKLKESHQKKPGPGYNIEWEINKTFKCEYRVKHPEARKLFSVMKLIVFAVLVGAVYCIPVDNGVEGEPEVECGPTAITVNFNTRNPFEGHVYVKGLYDQKECRNDEGGRQVAGIELPFDSCNTARTRSLNPRGVFVSTTVVISFHPQFVTKVDRAYRIQCFYMESDKTVSTQIEVSDLTTAFQTQVVPMPICRYEILDGGPSGQPIQFATIGQQGSDKIEELWTAMATPLELVDLTASFPRPVSSVNLPVVNVDLELQTPARTGQIT